MIVREFKAGSDCTPAAAFSAAEIFIRRLRAMGYGANTHLHRELPVRRFEMRGDGQKGWEIRVNATDSDRAKLEAS
jgi:plasmid maintenance system killer protein